MYEKVAFIGALFSLALIFWFIYSIVGLALKDFSLDAARTIITTNVIVGWIMAILSGISFAIINEEVASRFKNLNTFLGWFCFTVIAISAVIFSFGAAQISKEKDITDNIEAIVKAQQGVFNGKALMLPMLKKLLLRLQLICRIIFL